jgi:hypothetical protein
MSSQKLLVLVGGKLAPRSEWRMAGVRVGRCQRHEDGLDD